MAIAPSHAGDQHPEKRPAGSPAEDGDDDGAVALRERLAATERTLLDTREALLRALAEQDNARKVATREREEAVRFAGSRLAEDLVDTLDNLRRAIESVPEDASGHEAVKPFLAGVEATERNLLETLARHGVKKVDPLGSAFDPHQHHAMFQRPDAAAEGTVVEVLQPGYMLHDRLLRPAMVGVAVPVGGGSRSSAT